MKSSRIFQLTAQEREELKEEFAIELREDFYPIIKDLCDRLEDVEKKCFSFIDDVEDFNKMMLENMNDIKKILAVISNG